jgi:hypothetical protein
MISPLISLGAIAVVVAIAGTLWKDYRPGLTGYRPRRRPLVNDGESAMFERLREAFPQHVVLVKVSLAALISVPLRERERMRHRHVDFVVCDPALRVIAAVQLEQDEELQSFRIGESAQALLEQAGYRVFAWNAPPPMDVLRAALAPAIDAGPVAVPEGPYAARASSD